MRPRVRLLPGPELRRQLPDSLPVTTAGPAAPATVAGSATGQAPAESITDTLPTSTETPAATLVPTAATEAAPSATPLTETVPAAGEAAQPTRESGTRGAGRNADLAIANRGTGCDPGNRPGSFTPAAGRRRIARDWSGGGSGAGRRA